MSEEQGRSVTPETEAPEQVPTEQPEQAPTETVETLTAKLAKYQGIAKEQERRAKANADKAKQFDALTEQSKSDLERAQEQAQGLTGERDNWRSRAVRSEARAAARDFMDPGDAVSLLGDLSRYVDDSGEIDSHALESDLAELLKAKPYLARVQEPAGMRPNRAQGQSGNAPLTPSQLAKEAEQQQDWRTSGRAKADMLLQLRDNHH